MSSISDASPAGGPLLAGLLKLRQQSPELVEEAIADASRSLLGIEYGLFVTFDPESMARLLNDAEKVKVAASLLEQDARFLFEQDRSIDAWKRLAKALSLRRQALAIRPDPENGAHIERLAEEIGSG